MYKTYFILVIGFCTFQCSSKTGHQEDRLPNILLILTDDQGWGDVGFHDNDVVNTPHLDQLAQESTEFTRFYVSPVCAPTRASLLTGRYHLATGVTWVTHRKEVMRASEVTLAEFLKASGYRTGLFGKWHNGKQYPHDPNGQGFDEFLGFKEGHLNNYFDATLAHNQDLVATQGYLPDVLTDSAIAFMEKEGPFFCYLAYNTPHSPFQVSNEYFLPYKDQGLDDKNAAIYGMVTNIDHNVGRLLKALLRLDKEQETLVIFLSDNGPNGHRYNGGFKGIKAHVDEGGVRVPFLMRYPARGWNKGTKVTSMAAHIDLFPTLVELIGIPVPDSLEIHGKSLVSAIEREEIDTSRYFFTHQVRRTFDTLPGAVRDERYLLTLKPSDTALYDLHDDPYQQTDLSDAMPQRVTTLARKYLDWFLEATKKGITPESVEIGNTSTSIEFPASEIFSRTRTQFKGKEGWANDYLVDWEDGGRASWRLMSGSSREYEVILQASYQASSGSNLKINIGDKELELDITQSRVKEPVESPDRVKRGEVYEYRWPGISLGTVVITKGVHDLALTATNPEDLEVKSISLKPVQNNE